MITKIQGLARSVQTYLADSDIPAFLKAAWLTFQDPEVQHMLSQFSLALLALADEGARPHTSAHPGYYRLFINQKGVCAICGNMSSERRLAVDHNHRTGQVRGLLCQRCNMGLGLMRDDPAILRAATNYLENPPTLRLAEAGPHPGAGLPTGMG